MPQRIGLYPLTYKVSDRDNNVTEQVRSVEVYSMKPVFSGVTANPVQITATLEQNSRSHGTTSSKVNGIMQGSNVIDGSYEVVITGLADGQKPVVQRFPITPAEESDNGGSDGDYPAYAPTPAIRPAIGAAMPVATTSANPSPTAAGVAARPATKHRVLAAPRTMPGPSSKQPRK